MSIVSDRRYYIAIDLNAAASSADLNVKAAHELGHCRTGSFYDIHSPYDVRAKHEYRADKWAVHELIPLTSTRRRCGPVTRRSGSLRSSST